jgi:branched-chain amino acid transport system ATP-binding protein
MLEAAALHKAFGSLVVTDGVSLTVPRGGRHAVIGPNGAGKTTLFNLISGELRPDRGAIRVDGLDVSALKPDARARAGLARSFQRNNLFLDMTVAESLATAAAVKAGWSRRAWRPFAAAAPLHDMAADIAERVGLADLLDRPVRHLSYGNQRQLEIALALTGAPKVLLLDEPTAGMSPDETKAMRTLIAGLPRDLTILMIEHDMDVVFDLAEVITVLDYGRVLVSGTPDEIRTSDVVREVYLGRGWNG